MVRIYYKQCKDKAVVVTCTTRKANYVEQYFGKFTLWPSKEHYEKGNCNGAITWEGVYLGCDKNYLEIEGDKVATRMIKEYPRAIASAEPA